MKENKDVIKLKISYDNWSGVVLTTLMLLATIINAVFTPEAGFLIVVPVIGNIFLIACSTSYVSINKDKRTLACRYIFKKKVIRLEDIESVNLPKMKSAGKIKLDIKGCEKRFSIPAGIIGDNAIPLEKFKDFLLKGKGGEIDDALLLPDDKMMVKRLRSNKLVFSLVVLPWLVLLAMSLVSHLQGTAFPIVHPKFYEYGVFWSVVVLGLFWLAIVSLKKEQRHLVTSMILIYLYIVFPLISIPVFFIPTDSRVSATRDFENYEEAVKEAFDGDYHYLPEEIIDGEVVVFSYYHDSAWDIVDEVYLEVKYDEEEFNRIYYKYENKDASYFGEEYEEVSFVEDYFVADEHSGEVYISYGNLEKIIFDKENRIVIYYYLDAMDPFLTERSMLVKRFDVDIFDYEKYVKEKQNNTN